MQYYCGALQGEAHYNICINCDMTLTCNCQDWDGAGQLGDLRRQTFEEIFRGKKAQFFRERLLKGKFPIPLCRYCMELKEAREDKDKYLSGFEIPAYIMVENTCLCNFNCLHCARKLVMNARRQHRMSLEDIKIVADILKKHSMALVHYFSLGEPFLSPTILLELKTIRGLNPLIEIYTSTNGAMLDGPDKIEAALMMDWIFVSLNGIDNDTVRKYQRGGNFDKSFRNMKQLIEERNRKKQEKPKIEWKYVVFNHNDKPWHINRAIELAREANFDSISFWQGESPILRSAAFQKSAFFRQIGKPSWQGREIDFRFEQFVKEKFLTLLGREPEPEVLDSCCEDLRLGLCAPRQFVINLVDSDEFKVRFKMDLVPGASC